jgi:hypothetical protein
LPPPPSAKGDWIGDARKEDGVGLGKATRAIGGDWAKERKVVERVG